MVPLEPVMPSMGTSLEGGASMQKAFDSSVTCIYEQVGLPTTTSKFELQKRVWSLYVAAVDITVPLLSSDGKKWLVSRDKKHNDRGDKASILQKRDSIKVCGLIWGIGGGPFLVQTEGQGILGVNVEYQGFSHCYCILHLS